VRRTWIAGGVVVIALLLWTAATLPPRTASLPASVPGPGDPVIVRGAYHAHTRASDGTGTMADVAAAAGRAGLDFVIVTDHGDAFRAPAAPSYYGRVLCLDATEISTTDGHYTAIGMARPPYPLAGEGRDVIEDVTRLGGFGVAAHPDSARETLRWREWDAPFDAIEWLNADSEFRRGSLWRVLPTLAHYLFRRAESLAAGLRRPDAVLERWDRLTRERPVVALGANDAHARFGLRPRDDGRSDRLYLALPSYESTFRLFSLGVELDAPPSGDAARDAAALMASIRRGRVYTAITALAAPARLSFGAWSGAGTARQGGAIAASPGVMLRASANLPPGGSLVLLRDGTAIERTKAPTLRYVTDRPGVFRIEVQLAGAPGEPPIPWILGNPIYVGMPAHAAAATPPSAGTPYDASAEWHVEHDAASIAATEAGRDGRTLTFRLAPAPAASPFAALVTGTVDALRTAGQIAFEARASRPMRVSVQVRLDSRGADRRWVRSVYVDETPRLVSVSLADMRVAGTGERTPVDPSGIQSLLFVVDTVNARPGDAGTITIRDLRVQARDQVRTVSSR